MNYINEKFLLIRRKPLVENKAWDNHGITGILVNWHILSLHSFLQSRSYSLNILKNFFNLGRKYILGKIPPPLGRKPFEEPIFPRGKHYIFRDSFLLFCLPFHTHSLYSLFHSILILFILSPVQYSFSLFYLSFNTHFLYSISRSKFLYF